MLVLTVVPYEMKESGNHLGFKSASLNKDRGPGLWITNQDRQKDIDGAVHEIQCTPDMVTLKFWTKKSS